MPPDVRSAPPVLVKQPGRFEQDVGAEELFQTIQQARMCTQLPSPAKKEMERVKPRHTTANGLACLFNFSAIVANFVLRQDRDRVKEPQFLVVRQLLVSKNGTIALGHVLSPPHLLSGASVKDGWGIVNRNADGGLR